MNLENLNTAELEAQFNPRVAVSDAPAELARWAAWSEEISGSLDGQYDLSYGDKPGEAFDLHPVADSSPETPVLVFIHGGYWRALDKAQQRFVPRALNDVGLHCINLNYPLCPEVTLTELNRSLNQALRFILNSRTAWGMGASPLIVMGHSAGAHAAAMLMADEAFEGLINGVVAVSGIYDTRIVRRTSINDDVRMSDDEATALNTLALPPVVSCPVLITVGGDEPDHWRDQSRQWASWLREHGLSPDRVEEPGCHHFSVLEAACGLRDGAHLSAASWIRSVTGA